MALIYSRSKVSAARTFASTTRLLAKVSRQGSDLFDDYERYMRIRESLDVPTNIVYLEDLLKKHQALFRKQDIDADRKGSSMRLLYGLTQIHTADLLQANRPIAVMEFLRNLTVMFKARRKFDERFTESRIVTQQLGLYQILKEFGDDPVERWEVIQEAKSIVERISPDGWDDQNVRRLRAQRAQIVQYYAAEEGERYNDPLTRKSVLFHLVASHEEVLQLESGLNTPDAEETRVRSLRAICGFKEEQTKDEDYQVYARELHKSVMSKFKQARSEGGLTCILSYEMLSSNVTLCKAYARAKKWEEVLEIATKALDIAGDINWDDNNRAHVEISQLLVYRSRGYLNSDQPMGALDDAKDAVREADSIPWQDEHPDEYIRAEYPNEYKKYRWQNFAQLNLIDILYDRQVLQPEEQFGLVQAEHGLRKFTSSTLPHSEKDLYENQYRRKKIRALRRLERWHDVLADCRILLRKSVQLLSMSETSYLMTIVDQMVDTCEDAATSLEELGMDSLSGTLIRKTDSFSEFFEGEAIPLESYITRSRRLQREFDAVYKEANAADPRIATESKQIEGIVVDRVTSSTAKMLAGLRSMF